MRQHRFFVTVTIVCVLILAGLAVACTPQVTPTDQARVGSSASPQGTPGHGAPLPPIKRGHPEISSASEAVSYLGFNKFPNIYAGGVDKPDGTVVIYLGPGDDSPFLNALHALLASSPAKASGSQPEISIKHVPPITVKRVPHSVADFTAASKAYVNALPQLEAQGFVPSHSRPDYLAGTYDVFFAAAPKGMTVAGATAELQKTVSPLIRVTSVNAPREVSYDNREHDYPAYTGGDLVKNPLIAHQFCTTGFTVIGALNYPRATTDHHCGEVPGDPPDYTNGGWVLPAPSHDHNLTPTPDTTTPFDLGATSNHDPGGGYADIQFLRITGGGWTEYGPYVWVGSGTSQPTRMAVGNPSATYPRKGDRLTVDGSFSRMVRQVPVYDAGPGVCYNGLCGLIELEGESDNLVWPVAQPGDSGGPVFCYACYGANGPAKPYGMIEGGPATDHPDPYKHVFATFIQNDLAAIPGSSIWVSSP